MMKCSFRKREKINFIMNVRAIYFADFCCNDIIVIAINARKWYNIIELY